VEGHMGDEVLWGTYVRNYIGLKVIVDFCERPQGK